MIHYFHYVFNLEIGIVFKKNIIPMYKRKIKFIHLYLNQPNFLKAAMKT